MSRSVIVMVVASGVDQGSATILPQFGTSCFEVVTTPPGSGVLLPVCQVPSHCLVSNNGVNSLNIYPQPYGEIDSLAINTPYVLASGSKVILYSILSVGGPLDWLSFSGGSSPPPYEDPAFTSFGITGISSPVEVGATIAAGSYTFTWTTSNSSNVEVNSISIVDTTASVTLASDLANTGSDVITLSAITNNTPSTQIWTIIGENTELETFSDTFSVVWLWKVYAGDSANVVLTAAEIQALTASDSLQSGFAGTYEINQSSDYGYFSYPDSMGSVSNFIDAGTGLPIDMADSSDNDAYSNTANGWSYALISVTNDHGVTTNYRLYRTTNSFTTLLQMRVS